jgi:hypothetical protein
MSVAIWLLLAAVLANGLLAGASLDQSIKQLPARSRIGPVAYSEYSKAADLGNGVVWYAALGVGAALITVAGAVAALHASRTGDATIAAWVCIALTIAHSLVTTRAAPTNFSQRKAAGQADELAAVFNRFERLQTLRVSLQVLTLLAVAWALVTQI